MIKLLTRMGIIGMLAIAMGSWPLVAAAQDEEPEAVTEEYPDEEGAAEEPEGEAEEAPAEEVTEQAPEEEPAEEMPADTDEEPPPPPAEPTAVTAEPAAAAPAAEAPEEIVVTGTRIKRKQLATAAPVSVLTREDLLNSGMVSIGEILQNLPSQGNGLNVNFNNGGTGATRINMRGIGEARTLVLINGRRHVAGGLGANYSVDLNAIPIAIIERVEVLKDGASSIYGSDAIGGVVNIITRSNVETAEVNGYVGSTQRGDGEVWDVSGAAAVSSEKGSLMFSAGFYEQRPIWAGDRNWSKDTREWDYDAEKEVYIGSPTPPEGVVETDNEGDVCTTDFCFNDPETGWRDFDDAGTSDRGTGDYYNYAPANYLVTPQRRYNIWTGGEYRFTDSLRTYFEGSYMNRKSNQKLAAMPTWVFVDETNPYNDLGVGTWAGLRMLAAGNRAFIQDIDTMRLVLGLDGQLPEMGALHDWEWDFNINFGRTEGIEMNRGQFQYSRLDQAAGPAADCTGDCVPIDMLHGADAVTQEMIDWITFSGASRGYTEQRMATLSFNGPLFELMAGNPVGLAFGYEYRTEKGGYLADPLTSTGDTTGNAIEPVKGKYSVHEGFAEINLPLFGGMTGVELFEVNASARAFNYDTFGSDFTYKVGGRWQIVDFLAARGTYSTAFRAPSVNELYSGAYDSYPNADDPCSEYLTTGSPDVIANCQAEGIPDTFTETDPQVLVKAGGNPDLDPETAVIITGGLVLEPSLVEGLSAAVDYWNIEIENSIEPIGAGIILSKCYNAPEGERQFCELITRNAGNNRIENIIDPLNNIGGVKTSGVDFDVRYSKGTSVGRFGVAFETTYLIDYIQVAGDGYEWSFKNVYDAASASSVSNGGIYPDLKLNGTLMWMKDAVNAGVNVQWITGSKECDTLCNAKGAPDDNPSRDIDAWTSVDVFAGYNFETYMGQSNISIGMNNALDADPPYISSAFANNADSANYDHMGRYFYARVGHRF